MLSLLGIALIVLLGVGVFYYLNNGEGAPGNNSENQTYTEEESREIAREWIETQAPTYTYDGDDLQFQESRALDLVDCENCYEFDFSFKSRQAGFGDRSGKMSAQVITPHLITVWVENGEVTKALTDNQFNEITGEVKQGGQGADRLEPRTVQLFYYNKEVDEDDSQIDCDANSVQAVERVISGEDPIEETIKLLLQGEVREGELEQGFETEFPNPDFSLENYNLEDGTLTLTFSEVPGFTSGGSCRVNLLRAQVEKTAKQFPEVEEVEIKPESIFQP